MSEKITSFFTQTLNSDKQKEPQALEMATAALLIEMIHMDDDVSDEEHKAVFNTLKNQFKLSDNETEELYHLAKEELKKTTDYHHFTHLINQHFTYADKLHMITLLWQMAYSDKQLHRDEAYFVQKIGHLLEVSQDDFDNCRNKVRDDVL